MAHVFTIALSSVAAFLAAWVVLVPTVNNEEPASRSNDLTIPVTIEYSGGIHGSSCPISVGKRLCITVLLAKTTKYGYAEPLEQPCRSLKNSWETIESFLRIDIT